MCFSSNNTYSLDLYSGDLQTTMVLFIRNVSSHKTDWITTTRLLCLAFLLSYSNSLMNVLKVECLFSHLLVNSIATSLFFVYCVHIVCCCVLVLCISFSTLSPFLILMLLLVYLWQVLFVVFNVKRHYTLFIFVTILTKESKKSF